jgi:uncharacterized MAPEG superfamily protein
MLSDTQALAASAALLWVMLIAASTLRSKMWAPAGMKLAFGNRENMPEPSPVAGRADRAAKNMIENLVLFTALVAAAHFAGRGASERATLGANLFFWARLAYWPIYLAGIPYLRTLVWSIGVVGCGLVGLALL